MDAIFAMLPTRLDMIQALTDPHSLEQILGPISTLHSERERGRSVFHRRWERRQEGLSIRITLPQDLPPLRMMLVWDNLTGHYTVALILWLFEHGIMPLFTPLGGSWLNRCESVRRILKHRARAGHHPTHQRRSSTGWEQQHEGGIGTRRRLCGAARGRHAGSHATRLEVQRPIPDGHPVDVGSGMQGRCASPVTYG